MPQRLAIPIAVEVHLGLRQMLALPRFRRRARRQTNAESQEPTHVFSVVLEALNATGKFAHELQFQLLSAA